MGIRLKNDEAKVAEIISARLQKKRQDMLDLLCYVGESAVAYARSLDTYKDQTGNLRSSIGYVVLNNGVQYKMSDFEQVAPKEIAPQWEFGSLRGAQLAYEIAKKYQNDMVLIVVAGMNYAAAVESKGYDVLTGSQLHAEKMLKRMIRQLNKREKQDGNRSSR